MIDEKPFLKKEKKAKKNLKSCRFFKATHKSHRSSNLFTTQKITRKLLLLSFCLSSYSQNKHHPSKCPEDFMLLEDIQECRNYKFKNTKINMNAPKYTKVTRYKTIKMKFFFFCKIYFTSTTLPRLFHIFFNEK